MLRQWCSRANDGTRAPLGRLFLEESRGSFDRWSSSTHNDGKEKFMFLPIPPPSSKENDVDHFKPKPKPTPASGRKTVQVAAAAEIDTVAAMHRIAYSAKCPSFEVLLADGALRAVRQVRSGGLHRRERVDGRRRHGRWPRPVVLG
uniref:Uncharacterized protein n=1 Tax=Oryza nivara TaxID=4536 RepID=A0A0E0G7U9_ORYNI